MAEELQGRPRELYEGKNCATVAIPRADGTVQTVVTWVDVEGDNITLNSAEGRAWPENLRRSGTATVSVWADGNPMEWAAVTGRLADDTHDGADDHIDALANKFLGVDSYPFRQEGEQRIKFVLSPERVHYNPPPPEG